jgi:hypothetical protein
VKVFPRGGSQTTPTDSFYYYSCEVAEKRA